jgi:hypothetical protein
MRFRTKFQWAQFAGALLWIVPSYAWVHKPTALPGIRGAYLISGIVWALIAISSLVHYVFTWWAIEDGGLIQHRLWDTRIVPWDEITRVGPWQPNSKPMYNWLAVDYVRAAPMSDRGELLFQPADRNTLLRVLRTHAPQATFDFLPFEL